MKTYRIKTELIENYRKEHNLSKTAFCKLCKIGIQTLNKIMRDDYNNVIPMIKIAGIIKVKFSQLIETL